MALLFTTELNLDNGITVANAYGRVAAVDQITGTKVDAMVEVYTSEEAFTSGLQPVQVSFNRTASAEYNRATDGTDILAIGHNALVYTLGEQGITATVSL